MDILLPFLPLLLQIALPTGSAAMIGLSLMISISFVALLYMLSYAIQSQQLTAVAKEELAALLFSIVLIGFWLTSDTFFNSIVTGLLESSMTSGLPPRTCANIFNCRAGYTTSHIDLADASLEIMFQKLKQQYISLYLFEILIGFLSTVSFPFGAPVLTIAIVSVSLVPFAGLSLLSQAHTVIVESISYLMTIVWAKQFILYFARDGVPILLLPLGLVMRAFPLFRTTGSTILAVCFAVYFVYPFSILLSNYLIFDLYRPADFTYNPTFSSPFAAARSEGDWSGIVDQAHRGTEVEHLREQFESEDVVQRSSSGSPCGGGTISRMLCGGELIVRSVIRAGTGIISAVIDMFKFMLNLTGDFVFTLLNNPALPSSVTAGLYFHIIQEVGIIAPFIILVTVTSVIEIILTITMFRNVSLLMGGEAEIIGISKIV